jgi:hypothetical protein
LRTSPLVGRKAWFGPRRFGWGLGPVSVEGWVVTAAAIGLGVVDNRRKAAGHPSSGRLVAAGIVALAVLKGTTPGGPRARRKFEAVKRLKAGAGQAALAAPSGE